MNHTELLKIINQGESKEVDFKRGIDISTAKSKSELVKDLIAIANSAESFGYLIIGVDDDRIICGCSFVSEEQLQQVSNSYINPPLDIRYLSVNFDQKEVIALQINSKLKPYKVSRDIDKILKDTVFVRRGSVTFKASPEEIIMMSSSNNNLHDVIKSIKAHKEIGNFDLAKIKIENEIESYPTAELYIELADIHLKELNSNKYDYQESKDISKKCLEYLLKSTKLDDTSKNEKSIRFIRLELEARHYSLDSKYWDEDFKWLKSNLQGEDYGKLCFLDCLNADHSSGITEHHGWLDDINEAIQHGYKKPEVYLFRAACHYFRCNYGLAKDDLDRCSQYLSDIDLDRYYSLKITVLTCLRKYEEAVSIINEARNKMNGKFHDRFGYLEGFWEDDIYLVSAVIFYLNNTTDSWLRDTLKVVAPNKINQKEYPMISEIINFSHR